MQIIFLESQLKKKNECIGSQPGQIWTFQGVMLWSCADLKIKAF